MILLQFDLKENSSQSATLSRTFRQLCYELLFKGPSHAILEDLCVLGPSHVSLVHLFQDGFKLAWSGYFERSITRFFNDSVTPTGHKFGNMCF